MNKYGKKWGMKVQDIALPGIGNDGNGLTKHSIDVTPEMKESVMEGQVMFSKGSANGKEITPLSNAGKKKVNSAINKGPLSDFRQALSDLSGGSVRLTDAVKVDGNHTRSLAEGTLRDT